MKARIIADAAGIVPAHRKDTLIEGYKILTHDGVAIVDCRIYGTKAANYACLWVHHGDTHRSGSGKAGGWGYHRPSAAVQAAITNAGYGLYGSPYKEQDTPAAARQRCYIGGVGDIAVEAALMAIAKTLVGRRKLLTVKCYA